MGEAAPGGERQEGDSTLAVVIIGRNEGARLRRCLASVEAMRQPAGGMDVVYVDSDSSDGSAESMESAGVRVIRLHPEWPTAALARNTGWRGSRSRYLLFLDGDSEIDPEFVTRVLPEFDDANVAAVSGELRERHSDSLPRTSSPRFWLERERQDFGRRSALRNTSP